MVGMDGFKEPKKRTQFSCRILPRFARPRTMQISGTLFVCNVPNMNLLLIHPNTIQVVTDVMCRPPAGAIRAACRTP
jgi:hypothetical protein